MPYKLQLLHPDGSQFSESFELNAGDTFAVNKKEYHIFVKDGLFYHLPADDYEIENFTIPPLPTHAELETESMGTF